MNPHHHPRDLYRRFAGKKFLRDGRTLTVYGIQSSPRVLVLTKSRRRQRIPDEWTPAAWLRWQGKASLITEDDVT